MLKKITLLFLALAAGLLFFSFRAKFYGFQPPARHTGAPDGFGVCSSCHGNLNTGGGSVVINGLPTSFKPGVTYPFSITISHPSERQRWGFAVSARNGNGNPVGSFGSTNPNAKLNESSTELAHYDAVFSDGEAYTYTNLTWTAPATLSAGDDKVSFYLAGNAANGNFNSTGDFIYTNTVLFTLPVTLKSFDYVVEGQTVHLAWTTVSETNSQSFVVEKSSDNRTFLPVGRVAAAGATNTEKRYTFSDQQVSQLNRPVFYRLKLEDLDGKFTYSKILPVTVKAKALLVQAIYPNPVADQLQLTILSEKTTRINLQVLDGSGRVVKQESLQLTPGQNKPAIHLGLLHSGRYLLRLQNEDLSVDYPFIKQ